MINRFYTPSLPQYTSQFVEDKTPWDQIIAFDKEKMQRTEQGIKSAGAVSSVIKSLPITGRTSEYILPQVENKYSEAMNKWKENYMDNPSSIPAMRELTNINSQFQSDPEVKKIIKDAEDEKTQYDPIRKNPRYPWMIDPNKDKDTGELKQLRPGEDYRDYAPAFDIDAYANEAFSTLKSTVTSTNNIIRVKDPITQMEFPYMQTRDSEQIDKNMLDNAHNDIFKTAQSAIGNYMSPEELNQRIEPIKGKYAQSKVQNRVTPVDIKDFTDNRNNPEEKPKVTGSFTIAGLPSVNTDNLMDDKEKGSGAMNKFTEFKVRNHENIIKSGYTDQQLEEMKNDPKRILYSHNSNALLTHFISINPAQTKKDIEDYFAEQEKIVKPNTGGWQNLQYDKKYTMNKIDKLYKDLGIDESPFANENEHFGMINAIVNSNVLGKKGTPFENYNELKLKDPENWTTAQRIFGRATMKDYQNQKSAEIGLGTQIPIDPKEAIMRSKLYVPNITDDGIIPESAKNIGLTSIFRGAKMIRYDKRKNTYYTMLDKDKQDLLKPNNMFMINSKMKNNTSKIGPNMYPVTTGDNDPNHQYFIEGSKEATDAGKLFNAAYSYKLEENLGVGDLFTVRDASGFLPDKNGQVGTRPIIVADKWDNKTGWEGRNQSSLDMQLRDNPQTGFTELITYHTDMHKDKIDPKFRQPYDSQTNPYGYTKEDIGLVGEDYTADPTYLQWAVANQYYNNLNNLSGGLYNEQVKALEDLKNQINSTPGIETFNPATIKEQ